MRFFTVAASLAFAVSPALAHFTLSFPDSRGANHETQASSPCGGLNSVVLPRTSIDPDGSPILTSSSHAASGYEVNFCLGNDCVDAASFNYSIVDPLLIVGSGNFCISAVDYESEVWNGSSVNGTIQVIYLSDDGELYNVCHFLSFIARSHSNCYYSALMSRLPSPELTHLPSASTRLASPPPPGRVLLPHLNRPPVWTLTALLRPQALLARLQAPPRATAPPQLLPQLLPLLQPCLPLLRLLLLLPRLQVLLLLIRLFLPEFWEPSSLCWDTLFYKKFCDSSLKSRFLRESCILSTHFLII